MNLLARIEDVEDLLRMFPFSGRMTTIQGVRRIPVAPYPYVLDYRCIGSDIVVQRIRHTSRRPLGR
jgi:toxin ParE1/3/4